MGIIGVNSLYTDYLSSTAKEQTSTLKNTLSGDLSNASDEELLSACKEFEAYFLEQMFDAMMETTKAFTDDEEDSYAGKMVDYFKDSAVTDLANQATEQNGIGLARTLYEQMKMQASALTPEEAAATIEAKEAKEK